MGRSTHRAAFDPGALTGKLIELSNAPAGIFQTAKTFARTTRLHPSFRSRPPSVLTAIADGQLHNGRHRFVPPPGSWIERQLTAVNCHLGVAMTAGMFRMDTTSEAVLTGAKKT